ncbi:hypothetical protein [Nostoc sp.]|uniref:hypothetical protein n=1 Tax=Nostoc sp. TaxID=1180 RepID=UPI002FF8BC6B
MTIALPGSTVCRFNYACDANCIASDFTVKVAYSKAPELKVERIYTLKEPDAPEQLRLKSPTGD